MRVDQCTGALDIGVRILGLRELDPQVHNHRQERRIATKRIDCHRENIQAVKGATPAACDPYYPRFQPDTTLNHPGWYY